MNACNAKTLLFYLFVFIFFSCNHGVDGDKKTVFRYNESAGITSLDPAFAKDQANIWACNQIFNSLVQLDSHLNIVPCLAKSWTISEDGKIYRFVLRENVFFHQTDFFRFPNGKRSMIASDVVYSFNRIMDKKVASPGAWIFDMVQIDREGKYCFFAVNDSIVEIRLRNNFPPFLGLLCMQYCSIVPHEAVEKYGKDFRKYPVGTGAFQLKTWKEDVKMVLVKNPDYFEFDNQHRQLPYLDAVSISFIIDKQAVFMEFVKGNLDFMSGLDASYKDELLTGDGRLNPAYETRINMTSMPYLNTEYLGFLLDEQQTDADKNPLLKKEIRQAINYGFDRKKMLRFLRSNIGVAGINGIIPYGLPPYDSTVVYGYDYRPEKVRELLTKAGYPNGKNLPPIKLFISESYMDVIQYIAHELKQLGIEIEIVNMQPAVLRQFIAKSQISFFRGSWIADYPDAENYLSLFYSRNFSPNGPNYTHYHNAVFDKLYEQSQSTHNDSSRFLLYQQMDKLLMEEAPVVILYYDRVLRFTQKNIEGLENNAMNLLTLKRVRKRQ
ncbi:MAG: ABC transporter substrate-binding protein [Bacteroidales bacterium]|jgi:peptide/nickel transport system substrate-binding protein|nr:ABC transporter substrate-binding protein [Bacteroidales bacterium]